MTDNLLTGPDSCGRHNLSMLRAHEGQGTIEGGRTNVIDSVFLSCDPDAYISGKFESNSSNMLNIRMQAPDTALWQALHVELGALTLGDAAIVGFAARSRADFSLTIRPCIRSGNGKNFVDTFFPKTLVSFSKPSTHLDFLDLTRGSEIPERAEWRDLILFFRSGNIGLEILDLRLFVV